MNEIIIMFSTLLFSKYMRLFGGGFMALSIIQGYVARSKLTHCYRVSFLGGLLVLSAQP